MILNDSEIEARLESPLNLINKLRSHTSKTNAMNVFGVKDTQPDSSPVMPPSVDDLIIDVESKIKLGGLNRKALDVLDVCLDELKVRLPEASKPENLSRIASDMGKITASIRDSHRDTTNTVQVLVYAPQIIPRETFDVIDLGET